MALETLQAVIGSAVINPAFRTKLLGSPEERDAVLQPFALTAEERVLLKSIRADTLEEFAAVIDAWIAKAKGQPRQYTLYIPQRINRVVEMIGSLS